LWFSHDFDMMDLCDNRGTSKVRLNLIDYEGAESQQPILAEAFSDMAANAVILDAEGRIVLVNDSWRSYYQNSGSYKNPETFIGSNYIDICERSIGRGSEYGRQMAQLIRQVIRGKTQQGRLCYPCQEQDGQHWYLASVVPLKNTQGVVVIHFDVSVEMLALAKLEKSSLQAQSLAHDLKNVLSVVIGQQEIALKEVSDNNAAENHLSKSLDAAKQAASLCMEIMSVDQDEQPAQVDLNKLVTETIAFYDTAKPSDTDILFEPNENMPTAYGNAPMLKKVLTNLLMNAIQAVDGPGLIRLRTGLEFKYREYFKDSPNYSKMDAGIYYFITICDTGPGVPESVKARLFEPFVTDKISGHGIGLNSAMTALAKHAGTLELYHEPEWGACFRIWLPAPV